MMARLPSKLSISLIRVQFSFVKFKILIVRNLW